MCIKMSQNTPTFIGAMTNIVEYCNVEKLIAFQNNKQNMFQRKWKPFL